MDKRGTILYIGGFELPDKNAAAHRVLSIGKILREIGYKVVFISVDKEIDQEDHILKTKKIVMGFDTYALPHPSSDMLRHLTSIEGYRHVLSLYPDTFAVICYNYPAVAFERIRHDCKHRNIFVLADCTEWYGSKGRNILFRIVKQMDSFLRMRVIQHRIDALFVISSYLSGIYRNKRNVILPPLVDLDEDKWKAIEMIEEKSIRLVYAGESGPEKEELRMCIQILHKLTDIDFTFHVVGETLAHYRKRFPADNDKIEALGDKIVFLGRLSHQDTLDHIKQAHYIVFFREENRVSKAGFPTKFVESISCGTPVITNRSGDLQSYLIEGKNGYFVDLYQADTQIRAILARKDTENSMMKEYCRASKRFDFHDYIMPVKHLMEKLVEE
jgi:glycosyltransferase involved in cell wall biosynthesis